MEPTFTLPSGMKGRFGVVKLWPDIKVAEDEVIARLQNTARQLGLECVAVNHLGEMIDEPRVKMTKDDLDFVINLHFTTPKSYDIFSFVVLWNPLQFYHDFGYRRNTPNLLTHDDFLSCGSPQADDQIRRMIANDPHREGAQFTMFHSLSDPTLEPTLGDRKLFYAGINWERLGRGMTRHQGVLDELDETGKLRIYGPRLLRDVKVWEGYKSYQGSLPFDGRTMITEINRAGIALVLSSEAHIDAQMMSNRLFEALAAGAVVICDQNMFAVKHFGDALLYIDTAEPVDEVAAKIVAYIRWVEENPDDALALARRAQKIFRERFSLHLSIAGMYEGFTDRRARLEALAAPVGETPDVSLLMLMPRFDAGILDRHLENAKTQRYPACRATLVLDAYDWSFFGGQIEARLQEAGVGVQTVNFFTRDSRNNRVAPRKQGVVLGEILDGAEGGPELVCLIGPEEQIFDNHIQTLVGTIVDDAAADYAASEMILKTREHWKSAEHSDDIVCYVQHDHNLFDLTEISPTGLCRYLFKRSRLAKQRALILPYLNLAPMAGFAITLNGVKSKRATAIHDIRDVQEKIRKADEEAAKKKIEAKKAKKKNTTPPAKTYAQFMADEYDLIREYDQDRFDRLRAQFVGIATAGKAAQVDAPAEDAISATELENLMPFTLYLDHLSAQNRRVLLIQLLQGIPVPRWLRSFGRAILLRPRRAASPVTAVETKKEGSQKG